MKIVTYNVNGLRSRVAQHGSLLKLLNSLDADIICLQETKLSRQELSADLTMAEGYDAFFSCTRTSSKGRTGYSGVATFCRVASAFSSSEVTLPLAAEEGITGLLECSRERGMMTRGLLEMPFNVDGLENITHDDLLKVDSEGRCVITDHGHFVLFNLYGPRAVEDDGERLQFKLLFFKILQERWKSLLNQGKRVFVAGDLNIAPGAIDKCDAGPGFERNMFREWLRSMLRECGGPFFDAFRTKHPDRKEAYTCFPQDVGAEEFNFGTRIDHILIAGPCVHQNHDMEGHDFFNCHVEECDILVEFIRGKAGNAPKWRGGRSIKLKGSDHVPVYVILNEIPCLPVHNTPSLSVRYIPEVRGWQQTIVSLLVKRQVSNNSSCHELSNGLPVTATEKCDGCPVSSQDFGTISKINVGSSLTENSDQALPSSKSKAHSLDGINDQLKDKTENTKLMLESGKIKLSPKFHKTLKKKSGHSTCSQLTIRSFFQQPKALISADLDNLKTERDDLTHASEEVTDENPMENLEDDNGEMNDSSLDPFNEVLVDMNICSSSKRERDNIAILEWQRIQQKMKMTIPLCNGHGEPCVSRLVKKEGPNTGRRFYSCVRAKGPASNPEANCNHFEWANAKFKKKQM